MKRLFIVLAVAAFIIFAFPVLGHMAYGQSVPVACGPSEQVNKQLAAKYGEAPIGAGLSPDGAPVLVYNNPQSTTFTIIVRRPGGLSCVVAAGREWISIEPSTPQPKSEGL